MRGEGVTLDVPQPRSISVEGFNTVLDERDAARAEVEQFRGLVRRLLGLVQSHQNTMGRSPVFVGAKEILTEAQAALEKK